MTLATRIIALIYLTLGLLGVGLSLYICAGLAIADTRDAQAALAWMLVIAGGLMIFLGPALVGGLGLLLGKHWGRRWAMIASVLMLALAPVGTVLGGIGLVVLWPRGRQIGDQPLSLPPTSTLVRTLLIMVAALGTLGAMIGIGYLLHLTGVELQPGMLDNPLIKFAVIAVVATLTVLVLSRQSKRVRGARRTQVKREQADWSAERQRLRMADLSADPQRAVYAQRIAAGEAWSDEQIAYDLDLSAMTTCEHLSDIEYAMRQAGIAVKMDAPRWVSAQCVVSHEALMAQFQLAPSVRYSDAELGGRAYEDPQQASISCSACSSWIRTVHPREAGPGTAVFPR